MNKIFFIDDDPVMLMLGQTIIKRTSYAKEVVTAQNGQEAIEYYAHLSNASKEEKSNYPELIFLDLNMSIMNGWEFLDEFVESYYSVFPKTKVVILTSSINPKDEEKSHEYSVVTDFCTKPLTSKMLTELSL
jgi:CheY-like chemotaxis protein